MKIIRSSRGYAKDHLIIGGGMELKKIKGSEVKIFYSNTYVSDKDLDGEFIILTIRSPRTQHNINYLVWCDFDEFLEFLENDETFIEAYYEEILGRE